MKMTSVAMKMTSATQTTKTIGRRNATNTTSS